MRSRLRLCHRPLGKTLRVMAQGGIVVLAGFGMVDSHDRRPTGVWYITDTLPFLYATFPLVDIYACIAALPAESLPSMLCENSLRSSRVRNISGKVPSRIHSRSQTTSPPCPTPQASQAPSAS